MRKLRFIYARHEGGLYYRGTLPPSDLVLVLSEGYFHGEPVKYVEWANGNMDYTLGHPRLNHVARPPFLELWYQAPVEALPDTLVQNLSS